MSLRSGEALRREKRNRDDKVKVLLSLLDGEWYSTADIANDVGVTVHRAGFLLRCLKDVEKKRVYAYNKLTTFYRRVQKK